MISSESFRSLSFSDKAHAVNSLIDEINTFRTSSSSQSINDPSFQPPAFKCLFSAKSDIVVLKTTLTYVQERISSTVGTFPLEIQRINQFSYVVSSLTSCLDRIKHHICSSPDSLLEESIQNGEGSFSLEDSQRLRRKLADFDVNDEKRILTTLNRRTLTLRTAQRNVTELLQALKMALTIEGQLELELESGKRVLLDESLPASVERLSTVLHQFGGVLDDRIPKETYEEELHELSILLFKTAKSSFRLEKRAKEFVLDLQDEFAALRERIYLKERASVLSALEKLDRVYERVSSLLVNEIQDLEAMYTASGVEVFDTKGKMWTTRRNHEKYDMSGMKKILDLVDLAA